jgi:diguanylate cyclase (GGDEF)-like protein
LKDDLDSVEIEEVEEVEDEYEETDSDKTAIKGIMDLTGGLERRKACFIVISGSSVGKMYTIKNEMIIGRTSDCEIFLDDDGISRQHAKVTETELGDVILTDLNSTNGTYCDGKRLSRHFLRDGDKIQVGSTCILKFSFQDSVEEAFHQQQYESATRDGLTNIFNKKFFMDQLQKDFSYAYRHNEPASLILFDIDHFKSVNDTFGHPAGDMVLKKLAKRVAGAVRTEDIFARIGGEEFAIFLRQLDEKRSYVLAERVRRTVEIYKFIWEDTRLKITISLGIATLRDKNYADVETFIQAADAYLYQAKDSGRNRVVSSIRS